MLIRIIYSDMSVGVVDYDTLETLVKSDRISAFFLNEWVSMTNGHLSDN